MAFLKELALTQQDYLLYYTPKDESHAESIQTYRSTDHVAGEAFCRLYAVMCFVKKPCTQRFEIDNITSGTDEISDELTHMPTVRNTKPIHTLFKGLYLTYTTTCYTVEP
jgi:hypothetical protein